jgi:hypothetical protein
VAQQPSDGFLHQRKSIWFSLKEGRTEDIIKLLQEVFAELFSKSDRVPLRLLVSYKKSKKMQKNHKKIFKSETK